MNKTRKYMIMALLSEAIFAACSDTDTVINDINNNTAAAQRMTFTAAQENNGTRATVNGNKIEWQSTDHLSVFDGTSNCNFSIDVIDTDNATSATFTGEAAAATTYTALYPYQSAAVLNSTGDIAGVTLPANQIATAGSFDPTAALMMAVTADSEKNFAFKNAVAYLKVTTTEPVQSISFTSFGEENLAGTVTLSYNSGVPTATVTANGSATVTLAPASGTLAAGSYYIAVLPQTLGSGFQLSYIDENNITYTRNYNSSYTTVRNKVVNMGVLSSVTCNRPCDNNQIIYYAPTQQTLNSEGTINNAAPNINSHVFANGVGTITFAQDISSVKTIFWDNTNITKVILPATLTEIGLSTFRGCSSLVSVDIPQSVIKIDDYAFDGCTSLTSVVLPKGIQTLGEQIFFGCTNLKTISLPDITHLTVHTRFNAPNVEKFIIEGVEKCEIIYNNTLTDYAKANPQTSYTVPTGVTSINNDVFIQANNLRTVIFPSTLTHIGVCAFQECANLETVQIPKSVTTLDRACFYVDIKCSITFESGTQITEIPNYAFSNVVYAEIPTSVKTIGYNSYYGYNKKHTTKTNIVLHEGLTTIGEQAFYDSYNIEEITVPSTVTTIGTNAFACSKQAKTTTSPALDVPEDQQTRIKALNVKATTPPTGFTSLFVKFNYDNEYLSELTIYVPTASVDAYKAAAGWCQYADKIQGKNF